MERDSLGADWDFGEMERNGLGAVWLVFDRMYEPLWRLVGALGEVERDRLSAVCLVFE